MKTNIGIVETNSLSVAKQLSKILADEYVLFTKTKNAHWNIEGADFYDKHKFFETQFRQLDDIIDSIAERIRTIGHYAPATLSSFLKFTEFTEKNSEKNDSKAFIKELLIDHESMVIKFRENINRFAEKYKDIGTSDFITGLMQEHEKMAWLLRAHL